MNGKLSNYNLKTKSICIYPTNRNKKVCNSRNKRKMTKNYKKKDKCIGSIGIN